MPSLANAKQELYAKHRANGFIPKKAAVSAGYATGSAIYSELESDPAVVARIQELMDERSARREAMRVAAQEAGRAAGELSGVSQAWVITQLKNVSDQALEAGDWKEAREAAVKIGEQLGMFGKSGDGGGGGGNGDGSGQHVIDLDMLDSLTKKTDHLQPDKLPAPAEIDPALVNGLIQGHGPGAALPVPAREPERVRIRPLETGSETDVALRMPDPEDDPEDPALD